MAPLKLLCDNDNTFKCSNFCKPLPIFPDKLKPSSDNVETRPEAGSHCTYFQAHGAISSSFHELRDENGSWRSDLKTRRPNTSSLSPRES